MAEFKAITTQEEFDAAISGRLNRQKETLEAQFASERQKLTDKVTGYESQIGKLNETIESSAQKYADQDKTLAELRAKVAGYETDALKTKIANETGLPLELASRLSGEDEKALRADAQALAKLVKRPGGQPLADYQDHGKKDPDPLKEGLREALRKLNMTGE